MSRIPRRSRCLFFYVAFLVFLPAVHLHAYPEMVRHGYVNCTACHISPNGGGILNAYGRVQAEEVLSTFAAEGEGGLAHGLVESSERLSFGGQFRVLQLFAENDLMRMGRFVMMQADVEAAWHATAQLDVVATAGLNPEAGGGFLSRRHYLLYRAGAESPWNWRMGRFVPAFGLAVADHAIATRDGIGFGQGSEVYAVEAARLGQDWDLFITGILGRFGQPSEKGVAVRSALNLAGKTKVGLSAYHGVLNQQGRTLLGTFAIVGFTPRSFALVDLVFQSRPGAAYFGPAGYGRLNYEVVQGLHFYLTTDFSKLENLAGWSRSVGAGLQFFPRPHFELRSEYHRRSDALTQGVDTHYGWLMGHYYL